MVEDRPPTEDELVAWAKRGEPGAHGELCGGIRALRFGRPGLDLGTRTTLANAPETLAFEPPVPADQTASTSTGRVAAAARLRPEVVSPKGPIPAAHYCCGNKTFSGPTVPTRRRVFRRLDDGSAAQDQVVVEFDVKDVTVSP
jgi:hypothetical protein